MVEEHFGINIVEFMVRVEVVYESLLVADKCAYLRRRDSFR